MKTLQNTIEKVEKEFEDRFSPDWWRGFGTSDDINKLGVEGIKSFLRSAIKEAIQTAFEETRVEERGTKDYTNSHDAVMNGDTDYGYNKALEAIKIKQENYLEK